MLTIFNGLLVFVASIQALILWWTDEAMRLDQRAWVLLKNVVVTNGNINENDGKLGIYFDFINTGKTPSEGFYVTAQRGTGRTYEEDVKLVEQTCTDIRKKDLTDFRDSIVSNTHYQAIPGANAMSYVKDLNISDLSEITWIIGCAIYKIKTDTKIHETGFMVELEKKSGQDVKSKRILIIEPK